MFNATDQDDYDYVQLTHDSTAEAPKAYEVVDGTARVEVATGNTTYVQTGTQSTKLWYRVQYDGTNLEVYSSTSETFGNDAALSTNALDHVGGRIGFMVHGNISYVDDLSVRIDGNANGSFADAEDVLIHEDDFELTSGDSENIDDADFDAHDAAGNLVWDGVYRYAYDAWNRLVTVERAYREPGQAGDNLEANVVINDMAYDGLGRRIKKAVANSADLDSTYHYYYDGQSMVEVRVGSNDYLVRQYVWGNLAFEGQYIDELVQIAVARSVGSSRSFNVFYALQDANFNVLGVVNRDGELVERYEYTPYGQRTVYSHQSWLYGDANGDGQVTGGDLTTYQQNFGDTDPFNHDGDANGDGQVTGADNILIQQQFNKTLPSYANDPLVSYPTLGTFRGPHNGATLVALCDIGHQGLMHDEETGLVYNRARILHPKIGRFMQRDPLGYLDGMSLYEYVRTQPLRLRDPFGLGSDLDPYGWGDALQILNDWLSQPLWTGWIATSLGSPGWKEIGRNSRNIQGPPTYYADDCDVVAYSTYAKLDTFVDVYGRDAILEEVDVLSNSLARAVQLWGDGNFVIDTIDPGMIDVAIDWSERGQFITALIGRLGGYDTIEYRKTGNRINAFEFMRSPEGYTSRVRYRLGDPHRVPGSRTVIETKKTKQETEDCVRELNERSAEEWERIVERYQGPKYAK